MSRNLNDYFYDIIKTMAFREKVITVGVVIPSIKRWQVEDSLEELALLADTAGAEVTCSTIQERDSYNPAYLIGKGKVKDVERLCREKKANLVIFDADLTPAQVKNLEDAFGVKVLDRTELILDIFAQRAKTKEGKLQVELAQLRYLLPKLVGKGLSLSRLGGGIGTRGPGEMKLEIDRRRIREKIKRIEEALKKVGRTRDLHRKSRSGTPTVALVGYTNAGKSTLFNTLTKAQAKIDDKLFVTLDPLIRKIHLPREGDVFLSDTVGFIRKLPHHLVAAFRATLEEVREADLLLHVIDASSRNMEEQIEAVDSVLKELEVPHIPVIFAYNKIDRLEDPNSFRKTFWNRRDGVAISALKGEGITELLEKIEENLYIDKKDMALQIKSRTASLT